ncbi:MAG: N-acetyltransferase [Gammaproteobacteria bacterium]|jgi:putative acetyltransferase|nr:N-acetyltransferase [Thiotrichales bacterium]MBT7307032.1 N-acetyltransferase [Gammaproteobacteria bacterium]
MNQTILTQNSKEEVTTLFTAVFTASEGEKEGRLIGNLASELSSRTDNQEIVCFGTQEEGSTIGAIFFTRLRFNESTQIYMLAPVAVSTKYQGKGIGQALIHYGLSEMKNRSVAMVITYGDPAFYNKAGFQPLPEEIIQAPLRLSMPEGWLGQSLTGEAIPMIHDRPRCVKEFNNPVYW